MLRSQREKFFLQRKIAYVNCAYMSPMMKKVEQAGKKGIAMKRYPHRVGPTDFFQDLDTLRILFSKLVNNPEKNRVVTIPSVSYGMASVANNLKASDGDNIVLVGEQFPSNVYSWLNFKQNGVEIRIVDAPETDKSRGKAWNEKIIESIDSKTKLVAVAHVHWADGTLFDLKAIRKTTNEVGAWMVVDSTQSIGALPFDIQEIQPDALVAAGYKSMMGPYGIGLAYYGPALDDGIPIEENWINRKGSDDFTKLAEYTDDYRKDALKYGVGEQSNFILVPMQIAAIKQLLKWGPENIQEYCQHLIEPLVEKVKELGCWIEESDQRSAHLFGVRLPDGIDLSKIQHTFKKNRVYVSYRGNAIRISPNVYNDEKDIRRVIKSFEEALK